MQTRFPRTHTFLRFVIVNGLSQPFAKPNCRHTRPNAAAMAMAKFEERVQNKRRDELVELCFQALFDVKVARGELTGPPPASATESFKKKLENKTREEMVTMCFDALKERQASQRQNKRKVPEDEVTDEGNHKKQRDEGQTGQRNRRVLPYMPPIYVRNFSGIAQACEKNGLRLCRRPKCSDCYEKLIGEFEVAVQAICAELPEAKPQSTEKAAEWDKAYGDAYTTQQTCLDSFSIDQPDAVRMLRKFFAPGGRNSFPGGLSYSRQYIAAWMIDYYSELLRQRCEDGASEHWRTTVQKTQPEKEKDTKENPRKDEAEEEEEEEEEEVDEEVEVSAKL